MGRKFRSWSSTIHQPPNDTVIFPFFIKFDDTDGIFGLMITLRKYFPLPVTRKYSLQVLERLFQLAATLLAQNLPLRLPLLPPDTIGKISAISLMPSSQAHPSFAMRINPCTNSASNTFMFSFLHLGFLSSFLRQNELPYFHIAALAIDLTVLLSHISLLLQTSSYLRNSTFLTVFGPYISKWKCL